VTTPCEKLLTEIEARLKAATPGPWTERDVRHLNHCWIEADGCNDHAFIAHARTDLEKLAAMVKCARAAIAAHGNNSLGWYPEKHRHEATKCLAELNRIAKEGAP
jgi:hypothetical protein